MSSVDLAGRLVTAMTIGDEAVPGSGGVFTVENPATEQSIAEVPGASLAQCDDAVAAARRAGEEPAWADGAIRAEHLHRLADAIERRQTDLLEVIITEVGTPVSIANGLQIGFPISLLRWYADAAAVDRTVDLGLSDGPERTHSMVAQRPIGVVAAVTAYNSRCSWASPRRERRWQPDARSC